MGKAGQEKTFAGEIDGPQFDMGFEKETVDIAGEFEFLGKLVAVGLRPEAG
ncbi:MAG: hypothetical protein ACD_75C01193G0001 [uncultured bacterium]|nr:MAG: hypothetical protein ACD_75C01193G0001 [uncultured bacterium]